MFVFSFKASKFRILFAVVLCALIAFAAVVLLPETEHSVTVNGVQSDRKIRFDGMKTTADLGRLCRKSRLCGGCNAGRKRQCQIAA